MSSFKKIIFYNFLFLILNIIFVNKIFADTASKSFSMTISANIISTDIQSIDITQKNGYSKVEISGLSSFGQPGEPLLPYRTVRYLLPYGKDLDDVQVGWSNKTDVYGSYYIQPAQRPMPLSYRGPITLTSPDATVYSSTSPFPAKPYEIVSVQNLKGYKIAIINLYPVEYIPATGHVSYYENLSLSLDLKTTDDSLPYELYRGISSDRNVVMSSVDNPEIVNTYPENQIASLATVDYLIITTDALASYSGDNSLSDLATHKQAQGLTTSIVNSTTWATYSGARPDGGSDNATKIRNCILANYNTNGTQYVLLVGDADYADADSGGTASGERQAAPIIPSRGLYGIVNSTSDSGIPSDLYYACLGGDYDNDDDGVYGETTDGAGGADIDLEAEVFVGRAPVDSTTELADFVKKTIAYENSTASYLNKVVMAAEQLDSLTYGGDYMDEVKNGSSENGYTTVGMASTGYFSFELLYDRISSWVTADLVTKLNSGIHILNHLGHASNTLLGKTFANTDADGLTNTDYFIGYTQGCYSGAFDNKNSSNDYESEDCILEHFTTQSSGAASFIGNSRYGWYCVGDTDGPSQRYHREFWDAVVAEGKTNMGSALQDSKQDNIGLVATDGAYRWVYFCLNLLGDPHTPIYGDFLAPTSFSASNIFVANRSWVALKWTNSSKATLQNTMIRYRTDGVYPTSSTDGTLLVERTASPGTADTYNHTNIENGKTYHYVAFGYDGTSYEGNDSVTNRASVTIIGGDGGTSSARSDCFVATVCYGSKYSDNVKTLRNFRDRYLVNTFNGKAFIATYYTFGPALANWINPRDDIKAFVRIGLDKVTKIVTFVIGGN